MEATIKNPTIHNTSKVKLIGYWLVTAFITFELIYGALWDFNVLNKGYVYRVFEHLGYPNYLGAILGVSKIIAAIVFIIPGFGLVKEWAYTGVVILFVGAFVSHLAVGDGLGQSVWSLLFAIITIGSYVLRPQSRRITTV